MNNNTTILGKHHRPALCLALPALLFAGMLVPQVARSASIAAPLLIADVDVNFTLGAPPPPRQEVIVERDRPSRDHVWIRGYWANRHGRHEWVSGHWELPPRGRTVWVEPRWEKRDRGYVFIDGYWGDGHHDGEHHDHH